MVVSCGSCPQAYASFILSYPVAYFPLITKQALIQVLSLDGGHILSETRQIYRWSGRDRLALDACLSLSTSGPLCLDPTPSVHLVNNLSQSAFRTRLPKLPTKRLKSPLEMVSPQPQPITSPLTPQTIQKLQGELENIILFMSDDFTINMLFS